MNKLRVFLDADGVIVNAAAGASEFLNKKDEFHNCKDNLRFESRFNVSRNELNQKCFYNQVYWECLQAYSWSSDLIKTILQNTDNLIILTKSSMHGGSAAGKFNWFLTYFPEHINRLRICFGDKYRDCGGSKYDLLIDDDLRNISPWATDGGSTFWWEEVLDDEIGREIAAQRISLLDKMLDTMKNLSKTTP